MRGWITASEIASLNLSGLANTRQGVSFLIEREQWKDKKTLKGEPLARPRAGRGGGLEYHISLLPPEARAQLSAQATKINSITAPVLPATPQSVATPNSAERALRRDARLAVLTLADAHFNQNRGLGRVAADADFATKFNDQTVTVDAWLRDELSSVSGSSLKRWRKARDQGRWHAVGGEGRKAKSILDVANAGDVATRIAAVLLLKPHLSALQVRDQIEAEFGDKLLVDGKFVDLPHERSFQRFIVEWRELNKVFITQHTNPDAFKSKMRLTGGNMYAGYTRVNELWEIDASPADVLLKGGRHSIYLLIDIFSRRVMIHVSKTARTEASLLLLRKAILAWGVPETLRTDNGSDFTSEAFKRSVIAVGIQQDLTRAFSPEQKAAVERHIGTFQRKVCTLLPGFVGHNVADRKQIEQRRAFAARLGDTDANCFCVDINLEEFQDYCDRWAADDHAHTLHRALGMTPLEKARSCMSTPRTINNPHALDILLSPIPEQWRVVGKKGIQFDGDYYLAGSLLPGRRVYCRQSPDDYGTLLCFDSEFGGFLCEAICATRKGVNPHEVLAAARAERKAVLEEGLKEAKAQSRKIKPRHMVDSVLDMKRRKAIAISENVIELPKREETHTSPALESAAEAVAELQSPAFERLLEAASNYNSKPAMDLAGNDDSNSNVVVLQESATQRFKRAMDLQRQIEAGVEIDTAAAVWLGGYKLGDEFKAHRDMLEIFGNE
jgi:putative transposase